MPNSVAFLCLAKDCEETIPVFLQFLRDLRSSGLPAMAIVGENGSIDDTKRLLGTGVEEGLLRLVDTAFMGAISGRLERMARGREALKAELASVDMPTFVCVLDIDSSSARLPDAKDFVSACEVLNGTELFAVSATSVPTYYDLYAYEDDSVSFEDLPKRMHAAKSGPITFWRFLRDSVYIEQQALTSGSDLECRSAFNGLCIYKFEDYCRSSYVAGSTFESCEHLIFNRRLAASGRMMTIRGSLVLQAPPEHIQVSFPGYIWREISKRMRRTVLKRMAVLAP
jgi:hypothetical protein